MKSEDEALIRPEFFEKTFAKVDRRALLLFQSRFVRQLADRGSYDATGRREIGPFWYYHGTTRDDLGIAGPVVGAPAAAITLELLIALGCETVVSFGPCGAIDPDFPIGTVVVPSGAVAEEGTSGLYLPDRQMYHGDTELSETLRRAATEVGLEVVEGVCWSTDGFFRETRGKVNRYRDRGCNVVDMELSALYAVAEFRGIRLASLLVVSDELFGDRWNRGFDDSRFLRAVDTSMDVLLSLRPGFQTPPNSYGGR